MTEIRGGLRGAVLWGAEAVAVALIVWAGMVASALTNQSLIVTNGVPVVGLLPALGLCLSRKTVRQGLVVMVGVAGGYAAFWAGVLFVAATCNCFD